MLAAPSLLSLSIDAGGGGWCTWSQRISQSMLTISFA
jgi:hypothetical protein